MTSRFYSVATVLIAGVFGLVLSPDLSFVTAQAQTVQERNVEVRKLNQQVLNHLLQGEEQEALTKLEKILSLQRISGDPNGEIISLLNIGLTYKNFGHYI